MCVGGCQLVDSRALVETVTDHVSCSIVEPSWFSHAFDKGSGSTCEETLRRARYIGVAVSKSSSEKQNDTNEGKSSNDVTIDINDDCNQINCTDKSELDTSSQHIEKTKRLEEGRSLVIAVDQQQQQMIQEWKDNVERLEAKCAQMERELIHEKKENKRIRELEEATKNKLHAELLQQQQEQQRTKVLQSRHIIERLQSDNENIIQELHNWKNKCIRIETKYNHKCQEDCTVSQSFTNKSTDNMSQDESFSTSSLSTSTVNDEQLNSKCQVHEQEYQRSIDAHKMDIESMKVENHNLRASLIERDKKTAELIQYLQRCSFLCTTYSSSTTTSFDILNDDDNNDDDDENDNDDIKKEYTTLQTMNDTSIELAKHLTSEIHEKLALFLEIHENNVDTKMNALKSLNDDLSRQLGLVTKDNKQLSTDLEGANNLLLSSVHDEIKWDREREELFAAVVGLKQENEKLHESLTSMSEKKQVERAKVESLSKELELNSSTIHAVQSVLGSMKEEQTKIKETIDFLREENIKLRGQTSSSTYSLDVSSDSSTQLQKLSSSSLDHSSSHEGVARENMNLRKAYATLSSKLFDEMERTDSLRIANEGLATWICKLAALIQKQNNTLELLDRETIGGDDATTPATGNSNKSCRRRSITAPSKGKHLP
jgi:hypothetical protein